MFEVFKILRDHCKKQRAVLRVGLKWKVFLKKRGGGVESIFRNKIRSALSIYGQSMFSQSEKQAIETVRPIFEDLYFREILLKKKFLDLYKLLLKI